MTEEEKYKLEYLKCSKQMEGDDKHSLLIIVTMCIVVVVAIISVTTYFSLENKRMVEAGYTQVAIPTNYSVKWVKQ